MFFFKLINFLTGYTTLLVSCKCPEKFINMAVSRGIFIWNIRMLSEDKVLLQVRLNSVKPLRHIARKTGCIFEIQQREGLPFLLFRLSKRKALVIGGLIFLLSIYFLSSFVWFMNVTGNRHINAKDVLKAAEKAGLKRGVLKKQVNIGVVEKSIQDQLPDISWVGVYIKGTRADIEIVEKTLVKNIPGSPAHIVASKAGLVEQVLVLKGHPAIKEGDTVVKGQVLISGIIPPTEKTFEETKQEKESVHKKVHVWARGIVRARVWYEGYGESFIVEKGKRKTGRTITKVCMKIGQKEIILFRPKKISFAQYEEERIIKGVPKWRNLDADIELIIMKYHEIEDYTIVRKRSQARELAKKRALKKAKQQVPKDAIILKERVEDLVFSKPENLVRARAYVETLEDIGVSKPFRP